MTLAEAKERLVALRRSLEAQFTKAQAEGDTAEKERLRGIAGEIDDVLDNIALIGLRDLAIELTLLKNKIDGLATEVPDIGFDGLTLAEVEERVREIFQDSSEEELPPVSDADDTGTAPGDGTGADGAGTSPAAGDGTGAGDTGTSPAAGDGTSAVPGDSTDVSDDVTAPDPGISATGNIGLTEAHLIGLWKRSQFPIDGRGIIVFGLRGCQPVDQAGTGFAGEHEIVMTPVNYRTMNCTLGQWKPKDGFAVFPGSTVPQGTIVFSRRSRNGVGVNQMGCGRYKKYEAGWHKRREQSNGHWALRQECAITIQRTADDVDFDLDDRWEVGRIAGDNIHCAFHMVANGSIPDARFSSAGCQTVAGTLRKGVRGSERGPWRKFIDPFLNTLGNQKTTEYVLFNASEALQMVKSQCRGKSVILRMGSTGPLVRKLQQALGRKLNRTVSVDGDFGPGTFQLVIDFQAAKFGNDADDGIVGSETASELGFKLPEFDFADAISGGPGFQQAVADAPPGPPAGAPGDSAPLLDTDKIAWGAVTKKKHGPEFKKRVIEISRRLKCDPNHLMSVMAFETGEKFTPDVENAAGSGATGLIQFMPKTARGLGTTTKKLAKMTAIDQLEFVEKHFKIAAGSKPLRTLSDVYMAVLLPTTVGKPEGHVLFRRPSKAYRQNAGLDANSDGVVTKAEAATKVHAKLIAGLKTKKIG